MIGLRHATISGFCAVVLSLVGCGEKSSDTIAEKAIEASAKAEGTDLDVSLGKDDDSFTMTAKTEEGDIKIEAGDGQFSMKASSDGGDVNMTAGEGAKLPSNLPGDIPVYKDLKLDMVQTMEENEAITISGNTEASLEEVAAFYQQETKSKGWTETSSFSQPGAMQSLAYSKDGRVLNVMINVTGPGQTTVVLSTSKE